MGFESGLGELMVGQGFGSRRYMSPERERPHMSRSKMVANDGAEFVRLGEGKLVVYKDWMGKRYVAAEKLSYDFMLTLYDLDSPRLFAARLFEQKELSAHMERALKFVMSSGPDMEARIIGLQDGEEHGFLKDLLGFLSKHRIRLAEADLFGERIRHIAIDLKTGMSYNILLDDRIYKPSELVNRMTVEDFQRGLVTARR